MNALDVDAIAADIDRNYHDLGYTMGWKFLATPAATLHPDARLLILGLNPGGDASNDLGPTASYEPGNEYRLGHWPEHNYAGHPTRIQQQVCLMYSLIAARTGEDAERLMDGQPAANDIPFRSPSQAELPNRRAARVYANSLWAEILAMLRPRVIITISPEPFRGVRNTLIKEGFHDKGTVAGGPAGWGNVRWQDRRLTHGDHETYLVRLPHLSRYAIFGNPRYEPATSLIVTQIANRI